MEVEAGVENTAEVAGDPATVDTVDVAWVSGDPARLEVASGVEAAAGLEAASETGV